MLANGLETWPIANLTPHKMTHHSPMGLLLQSKPSTMKIINLVILIVL